MSIKHNLSIDSFHGGAGKFRDLYIGTGFSINTLYDCRDEIRKHNLLADVEFVNVDGHLDLGKSMLTVSSFWWDE